VERTRIWILLAGLSSLIAMPLVASAIVSPPDVDPANFVPGQTIDNPYFPHPVGRLFVYEGVTEGVATHDEVCVTSQTRPPIEGVEVVVVHHRSFEDGVLVENTFDWFAQDVGGNVWYFGEDTTEFPSGSTEGSWEGGVDDADSGFIMLADPQQGDRYYQEFARNVAEDQAKVLSLDESLCLESGQCYDDVLLTKETSRLDPGVLEYKYYAPNVGFVRGTIVKGGDESTELVSIGTCSE
jgi:hypothetical protein